MEKLDLNNINDIAVCEITLDPTDEFWDSSDQDELDNEMELYKHEGIESRVPKSSLKEGDVIVCDYPYRDMTGRSKSRRAVIMNDPDGTVRAVMISSTKDKPPKLLKYRTNFVIKDWKGQGFTEEVFFSGSNRYLLSSITWVNLKGHLTDDNLAKCKKHSKVYEDTKFNDPWIYLAWLKNEEVGETTHPSGNNNLNKLQTFDDIKKSKKANCIDISSAVHYICDKMGLNHRIVWTRFLDSKGNSRGHVYCLFASSQKGYAFRYDASSSSGSVFVYRHLRKFVEIKDNEVVLLKKHFDKISKESTTEITIILNEEDIAIWDKFVKARKIQKDLMAKILMNHEENEIESILVDLGDLNIALEDLLYFW